MCLAAQLWLQGAKLGIIGEVDPATCHPELVEVLRSGVSGAKPRSDSDEGISYGIPIALRRVSTVLLHTQKATLRSRAIGYPS